MALLAGEQSSGGQVLDTDGRLIVVGPGGVAIAGGGGGSGGTVDIVDRVGRVLGTVEVSNFPASQAVSDGGGSLTVDGTVTANAGTGPWPVTDNGGALSVDDAGGSLTVDGSVSVANFPATQDVSDRDARVLGRAKIHDGTNVASVLNTAPASDTGQSALAVRVVSQLGAGSGGGGATTDVTDRAARLLGHVNVDNFPATQPVSGTVGVSSLPALGAGTNNIGDVDVLTLPALPTGDNTIGRTKLTDGTTVAAVDATLLSVLTAGASYTAATGTITTSTSAVTTGDIARAGNVTVTIRGTYAGVTVVFEGSDDAGTNWFPVSCVREDTGIGESTAALATNASQMWTTAAPGFNRFRVRATTYTSGTANVRISAGTYPFEPNAYVRQPKDSNRNLTTFRNTFASTSATDTLVSLTGYKNGAAVGATTTPAVVTAGRTLRIAQIDVGYFATAVIGSALWKLRANTAGVVAIGSPVVYESMIGTPSATAGVVTKESVEFPDGLEFQAGTGIGVSILGQNTTAAAAAVGQFVIQIVGYEYA